NAPYAVPKARWGSKIGDTPKDDLMKKDGLSCSVTGVDMGKYGKTTAEELNLTREEQDSWAVSSHEKAIAAVQNGTMAEEIVPVEVPQRKGDPILVETDEAPRKDTTAAVLGRLRQAFAKDGTVTAG